MRTISVNVDVDVDLNDIDTDDLVSELKERQSDGDTGSEQMTISGHWDPIEGKAPHQLLDAIFEARVSKHDQRALELIDRLIYSATGQIV